ncbi:hypothetical protein ACFLZY_02060 [Patescibacteria group bacterium]
MTSSINKAMQSIFKEPRNWIMFFVVTFLIFALFVMLPVWTTPGNDILFQLSLFSPGVYVLMVFLALSNALVIVMQFHVHKLKRARLSIKHAGSGFSMIFASLLATIGCAACYSSLLAIFGLGGTIFIVEHRWWFAVLALGIAFIAIAYTAKRINGECEVCKI